VRVAQRRLTFPKKIVNNLITAPTKELPLFGYLLPAAQAGKRGHSTALKGEIF